ncbi:MAG: glycoside hydrolase family 36 protein [Lentisphaeria bacterium]
MLWFTPAPEIEGEKLTIPEFDSTGKANLNNLELKRNLVKESESLISIELTLTNRRDKAINLNSISPIKIISPPLGDVPFDQYIVNRLARQKNDIPGKFNPASKDRNMLDAAFSSAEVVAGGGISWNEFDSPDAVLPTAFHCDPGLVVSAQDNRALFIGFDGQTKHLSDIVFRSSQDRNSFDSIETIAEFDGIKLNPGESCKTHRLIINSGSHERELFEKHIKRVANNYGTRRTKPRSVYCTWYYYGKDIDADEVRANLESLRHSPIDFDVFQIDMGWENYFGDWGTNRNSFPEGMKVIADNIKAAGYNPGIWTAPFVIDPKSQAAKSYSDIILRDKNGDPCLFNCAKGACYTIDPFAERAEEFLKKIFTRLKDWGFYYHKLDFMRAVFIHENARFQQPEHTRAEAYRRGLELIRKAVGEDVVINSCGGLYEGSTGLADIVRLGADLRGHWGAEGSNISAYTTRIKQNISRNFYNGLFAVDPDALQLRRNTSIWKNNPSNKNLSIGKFTDEEAFSIVVNQFLAGSIVCFSERLKFMDDDRRLLLHKVIPAYSHPAKYFGLWSEYLPELYSSSFSGHPDLPDWNVISMCNWNSDEDKTISFAPETVPELPQADKYAAFELKNQRFLGLFFPSELIELKIPGYGSRVVRLTPLSAYGEFMIGTDLNLSAGMELLTYNGEKSKLQKKISYKQINLFLFDYQKNSSNLRNIKIINKNRIR